MHRVRSRSLLALSPLLPTDNTRHHHGAQALHCTAVSCPQCSGTRATWQLQHSARHARAIALDQYFEQSIALLNRAPHKISTCTYVAGELPAVLLSKQSYHALAAVDAAACHIKGTA
eukprot:2533911-Pleurochrysis_carterae.AAC.3